VKPKLSKSVILVIISACLVTPILILNWLLFREFTTLFQAINIFALFIVAFPLILTRYLIHRRKKELEDMFPIFLRDFVEAIRSGMTVMQAFETISRNDYKSLSPFIKKMAAQLDWGVPLDKVLLNFAKQTHSKIIGRTVSSLIESHRFGGNLADTFEALSTTAVEIERLREERRLFLHSQMITGYIIFFVFLGVIIGLERFLVPSLSARRHLEFGAQVTQADIGKIYKDLFFHLILLQAFFAGLTVGKMAEGAMIAGLKHSLFMMFVGGTIFILFG
jgi:flagellar protein FlaJ